MKKGFTLIEVLAALVLMSVIILIAVPVYTGVRESVNESIYESKVEEVLARATSYASETNRMVFDVETLIEEGLISADNERGDFVDPRDGRSMLCDIIQVIFQDNQFVANIIVSEICYDDEELENLYGMIELKLYKDENLTEEIESIEGTEWIKESKVYVTYELKEGYESYEEVIESIVWTGEDEKSCERENKSECKSYQITTSEIKNVGVRVQVNFEVEGISFMSNASTQVLVDMQKPLVLDGSVNVDNSTSTSNERRVTFEITDNAGSGVKYYSIVREKSCEGSEYEGNKKQASDGVQSEYLGNGTYYICVEDYVGNKTRDEDLDNESNRIIVENVDSSAPVINNLRVSTTTSYNNLTPTVTIEASDDGGTENLRMCISNTGYMQNCTWEKYRTSKTNYNVGGSLDGGTRTIYVAIEDSAGNIVTRSATYTVYKECSKTTKSYTESNYGTCSKTCGGGLQYRAYAMKDNYTSKTCSTGRDSKSCNTQSCDPKIIQVSDTALRGTLAPLNSNQFVRFESYTLDRCRPTFYASYVTGQVITVNGTTLSYGPINRLTEGDCNTTGNGVGSTAAVRIDDTTLGFAGGNGFASNQSAGTWYSMMIVKVSGTNMWVSNRPAYTFFYISVPTGMGDNTIRFLHHNPKSNSLILEFNSNTSTKYRRNTAYWNYVEGTTTGQQYGSLKSTPLPSPLGDSEGRGYGAFMATAKKYDWRISLNDGTPVIVRDKNGTDVTLSIGDVKFSDSAWKNYGTSLISISHMGNNKVVLLVRNTRTSTYNLVFFERNNNTWSQTKVKALPVTGSIGTYYVKFIPLNDKKLLLNIRNHGIFIIEY